MIRAPRFRMLSVTDVASTADIDSKVLRRVLRTFPPCFNSSLEYQAWVYAARFSRPLHGICTDCTKEYHERMMAEHRCEHPEVEFKQAPDKSIEGFLPTRRKFDD